MDKKNKKKLKDKYLSDELEKEPSEGWGPGGGGSSYDFDDFSEEEIDEMNRGKEAAEEEYHQKEYDEYINSQIEGLDEKA